MPTAEVLSKLKSSKPPEEKMKNSNDKREKLEKNQAHPQALISEYADNNAALKKNSLRSTLLSPRIALVLSKHQESQGPCTASTK